MSYPQFWTALTIPDGLVISTLIHDGKVVILIHKCFFPLFYKYLFFDSDLTEDEARKGNLLIINNFYIENWWNSFVLLNRESLLKICFRRRVLSSWKRRGLWSPWCLFPGAPSIIVVRRPGWFVLLTPSQRRRISYSICLLKIIFNVFFLLVLIV